MIIPIRTETAVRRTPLTNYGLIAANIAAYIVLCSPVTLESLVELRERYLALKSGAPQFYQFLTYQFLHADVGHLLGNLLFLWIFGNSVNAKMGDLAYLLFYLGGGVFAAWGHAIMNPAPFDLVGASGAIAAVTTAYLALFPRSHVVVLIWFYIIHFVEVPAMLLIGVKIVVWDNLVAPSFGGPSNVAHAAHLSGYFFGFAAAMGMLLIRAIPRDQFDLLALWKRWRQRQSLGPVNPYGSVARTELRDPQAIATQERQLDAVSALRQQIHEALAGRDVALAAERYRELTALDTRQCLSEAGQLEIARQLYQEGRFADAALSFERFIECYPLSRETDNARLLLGILYARELHEYENAQRVLASALEKLRDDTRLAQCRQWLEQVRTAIGGGKQPKGPIIEA